MALRNKVDVRIAGKDYTLLGVESEEYIQKVSLYIDRKLNEVTRSNNTLSTAMASVLTSINVADDYFKVVESEKSANNELRKAYDEIDRLREENKNLNKNVGYLTEKNTSLQVEVAKREVEIGELRNIYDRNNSKVRMYAK